MAVDVESWLDWRLVLRGGSKFHRRLLYVVPFWGLLCFLVKDYNRVPQNELYRRVCIETLLTFGLQVYVCEQHAILTVKSLYL